jgi:hypothetical protein
MSVNPIPQSTPPTASSQSSTPLPAASTNTRNVLSIPASWTHWHTLSLMALLAAIIADGVAVPSAYRLWAWIAMLLLLTIFAAIAGDGVTGTWRGLLIDERNKISLSRLQATLWTLLVLSALFVAALSNARLGQSDPLAIGIPTTLWMLIGISTTSLVGSPLVLSSKKGRSANAGEIQQTLSLLAQQNVDTSSIANLGQVIVNTNPQNARWADLFTGEETGNAAQFDLAKIQMFYFTFILALVYAVTLGLLFQQPGMIISAFPDLSQGMLTLLGISHAVYLTNKVIPHSSS